MAEHVIEHAVAAGAAGAVAVGMTLGKKEQKIADKAAAKAKAAAASAGGGASTKLDEAKDQGTPRGSMFQSLANMKSELEHNILDLDDEEGLGKPPLSDSLVSTGCYMYYSSAHPFPKATRHARRAAAVDARHAGCRYSLNLSLARCCASSRSTLQRRATRLRWPD